MIHDCFLRIHDFYFMSTRLELLMAGQQSQPATSSTESNFEGWHCYALSFASIKFNRIPSFDICFFGFGFKSVNGLFVGWVEHPDIFCWVSFLYPTYLPAIFVLSTKPNKMTYFRIFGRRRGWLLYTSHCLLINEPGVPKSITIASSSFVPAGEI